ncbi:hypothetical protein JW998_15860 [candidate division KSB1 bacterium]|nr:hypothetical protein [candidate division KSB1 bacterium]
MKKLLPSIIIIFSFSTQSVVAATNDSGKARQSSAAPSSTLLKEPVHHGIYGAAVMKFSPVGPEGVNSLLIGGELYWVLNKKYLLGLGLNGLSTVVKAPAVFPVEGLVLVTNYGGLVLGYVHNSHKLIHLEAHCLGGIGQAFYRDQEYNATYNQNDAYLIFEPALNVVLNVTSAFRIGAGLSYRAARRVNLIGLDNKDLSGLTLNLSFRVGRF